MSFALKDELRIERFAASRLKDELRIEKLKDELRIERWKDLKIEVIALT